MNAIQPPGARPLRILVTGSRTWTDRAAVAHALSAALRQGGGMGLPVLVHGAAPGADSIAGAIWMLWRDTENRAERGLGPALSTPERYPARDFASPRARNQHMVDLGADVCLAFAERWASGTGMCARMARAAGIHTIDLGVSTASRRPDGTTTTAAAAEVPGA